MANEVTDRYYELYNELEAIALEPNPWYVADKIKDWGVYIYTKGPYGRNVFDICFDEIVYYDKEHIIPDEAWPWINKIQKKVIEIRDHVYANLDEFPNGEWLRQFMEE